jgi:hypothetical protein
MTNQDTDWRNQPTTVAIRDKDNEDWEYQVYPNWYDARDAVNQARDAGKIAIIYDGGSTEVPEFIYPDIPNTLDDN